MREDASEAITTPEPKELWEQQDGFRGTEQLLLHVARGITGGDLSPLDKEGMQERLAMRSTLEIIQWATEAMESGRELRPDEAETLRGFRKDFSGQIEKLTALLDERKRQVQEAGAKVQRLIERTH